MNETLKAKYLSIWELLVEYVCDSSWIRRFQKYLKMLS
jgi:hypothetical protein